MPELTWHWCSFAELGVDRLYDALALRCRVFILEQGPYQDPDGLDARSVHLLGYDKHEALQAYLRLVEPGVKFTEPSMGRVITAPEARGQGLGRELVARGVQGCQQRWPGQGIRISAQAHLQPFYASFGFVSVGDEYLEDDIAHREMVIQAQKPNQDR